MTRKKVVLRKDEDDLDMYDSQKDIELDYMPEIEEGIEEEKRKSLREELEAEEEKRASDLYKALEGVQEAERTNDLEKGVSEKQEMNEKRG